MKHLLNVRQDVSFQTGNIHFVGDMCVHGSVRAGFSVHANNVRIMGMVEGGCVKARRDLVIDVGARGGRPKVLNLFGYTGGASAALAKAGAKVTHVDAAKNMVERCKVNARLSDCPTDGLRYIVDDCNKFVAREIKRGNVYDAVLMDPPSYGRGPSGEIWKLEESICSLVTMCAELLSDKPLFFLINSYTAGLSAGTMGTLLHLTVEGRHPGRIDCSEIGIPIKESGGVLPCGAAARMIFSH